MGADHPLDAAGVDFQHLLIQEEQGAKGLILRRSADVAVNRQVRKELIDLRRPHLQGMAFGVKEDVTDDPLAVRLFGARAVMAQAASCREAIQKLGRLSQRHGQ